MPRFCPRVFVVCLLFLAPALAKDPAPVRVAWKFEKGKVRTEISENFLTSEVRMNGQVMEVKSRTTFWIVIEVADVKDGVATLKKTIKRVVVKMSNPQVGEVDWDSASGEVPEGRARSMIERYRQVLGKVNTIRTKASGEIVEVEGEAIDPKKLKGQETGPVFPETLSVGSKIEAEIVAMQGHVKVTTNTTYGYKGRFEGVDSFSIDAVQRFDVPPESPSQVEIVNQSTEGYYLFDANKGWSIGSASRILMQIKASAPQGTMTQKVVTRRRVLVVEGEDTKAALEAPKDPAPAEEKKEDSK